MDPPTEGRVYPFHTPRKDYEPPVPRWMLRPPKDIEEIFTVYVGIRCHDRKSAAKPEVANAVSKAVESVKHWIGPVANQVDLPVAFECFDVVSGYDQVGSPVWVAYWTDRDSGGRALARLDLCNIHSSLGEHGSSVGLWRESFVTPIERLETNYSGTDYQPGLAGVPNSDQVSHKYTAYWGAARDRLPASAYDAFERSEASASPDRPPTGEGEILSGTNYDNMVHIRTGQQWMNCDKEESDAYENQLEPTLMNGLKYLHDHPQETGNLGLRFLRNVPKGQEARSLVNGGAQEKRKETCAAAFFRSLGDLERWVQRHPSHLAIYNGAIKHAKNFAPGDKMRTWHEVSVLKAGEVQFEYVNCPQDTGSIQFLKLDARRL